MLTSTIRNVGTSCTTPTSTAADTNTINDTSPVCPTPPHAESQHGENEMNQNENSLIEHNGSGIPDFPLYTFCPMPPVAFAHMEGMTRASQDMLFPRTPQDNEPQQRKRNLDESQSPPFDVEWDSSINKVCPKILSVAPRTGRNPLDSLSPSGDRPALILENLKEWPFCPRKRAKNARACSANRVIPVFGKFEEYASGDLCSSEFSDDDGKSSIVSQGRKKKRCASLLDECQNQKVDIRCPAPPAA